MISRQTSFAVLTLNLALLILGFFLFSTTASQERETPRSSPREFRLLWTSRQGPLEPTWPDQPRFTSDAAFRPVAAGDCVLVTSSRDDCLTALAESDGKVRWRFLSDGPIRFAPAVWKDRVYVASDDGSLSCLDLATGAVHWRFLGGPSERRILGNERLINSWPARGGPVIAVEPDGRATVYFAAGIWPFMGIFLHSLDATTGAVKWTNSGDGSIFIKQPHNTDSFAGIAPQGTLVVSGDYLVIPGGRSIPAVYDRHTGKLLHYRLAESSKKGGGPDVLVGTDMYLSGEGAFALKDGAYLGLVAEPSALQGNTLCNVIGKTLRIFDMANRKALPEKKEENPKAKAKKSLDAWLGEPLATLDVPNTTVLVPAGEWLYGGGKEVVFAVRLPTQDTKAELLWKHAIKGTAAHLSTSKGRLYVSTRQGDLLAFGPETKEPIVHERENTPLPAVRKDAETLARDIVSATKAREGYAIVRGVGSGGLITELLRRTKLRLIVVEPDTKVAAAFRDKLRLAGIDGKRACVVPGTLAKAQLPPYLASLITSEEDLPTDEFDAAMRSLRPFGGAACWPADDEEREVVRRWMEGKPGEGQARLRETNSLVVVSREGALPDSGNWTNQHANAANTRVSLDRRVKAPLGVLWFGGPGNQSVLPRHGHGPVPQVCDGRLVIEGTDGLRAIDIYTGRLLWEAKLPGLGKVYDNTAHQPGANAIGSNYVTTTDGVYVAYRDKGLRLDPATGKTTRVYSVPELPDDVGAPDWTYLNAVGDVVIAGTSKRGTQNKWQAAKKKNKIQLRGTEISARLSVLDKSTGKELWSVTATEGFRHNAICIGNGKLFVIDRPATQNLVAEDDGKVIAFDLRTGRELWRKDEAFGTYLSYSEKHDVLVEAGLMSRDTLGDEPPGMRAYRGQTGAVIWYEKNFFGPAMIQGERILKGGDPRAGSGTACSLLTGETLMQPDPLTGVAKEWRWARTYGCNTPAASENLVLFRSGAAGLFDMCPERGGDGGTANLGGFRSSCTMNLIVAGGVLTVPDFTRTCTCSYQQQTSVGLIHTPDAELWTFSQSAPVTGPVQRVGVLLGAPGARKSESGTLWLDYPRVGGPAPKLAIKSTPAKPECFRMHSSQVGGQGPAWVVASGAVGLRQLCVPLESRVAKNYTVRLHFLEPNRLGEGERLFDVALQGKRVLRALDVSKEAGGAGRGLMKEFTGVRATGEMVIDLTPTADSNVRAAILSGVEVVVAKE